LREVEREVVANLDSSLKALIVSFNAELISSNLFVNFSEEDYLA
jgi:hypothetical protein